MSTHPIISRRKFVRKAALATVATTMTAKSYGQVIGADRLAIACTRVEATAQNAVNQVVVRVEVKK